MAAQNLVVDLLICCAAKNLRTHLSLPSPYSAITVRVSSTSQKYHGEAETGLYCIVSNNSMSFLTVESSLHDCQQHTDTTTWPSLRHAVPYTTGLSSCMASAVNDWSEAAARRRLGWLTREPTGRSPHFSARAAFPPAAAKVQMFCMACTAVCM